MSGAGGCLWGKSFWTHRREDRSRLTVDDESTTVKPVRSLLLWLFVINLGIAFGAGLYESRILVPQWLNGSPEAGYRWNAEAARLPDTGLSFWVYVTTVPLTLLTVANLIAAWTTSVTPLRSAWLSALKAFAVFHQLERPGAGDHLRRPPP